MLVLEEIILNLSSLLRARLCMIAYARLPHLLLISLYHVEYLRPPPVRQDVQQTWSISRRWLKEEWRYLVYNDSIGRTLNLASLAGESDKNTTMAWSCCVCSYSLAFIALSITAMVLASCKSEINANLNEKTTAVITEVDRWVMLQCISIKAAFTHWQTWKVRARQHWSVSTAVPLYLR